jgi:hypothetical protein
MYALNASANRCRKLIVMLFLCAVLFLFVFCAMNLSAVIRTMDKQNNIFFII